MKRRDLVNTLESLLGDSFDSSELVYLSDAELATLIHELQPAVEQMAQFSQVQEAQERALFVAFYYWQVGHPNATLWQTFDDVYALSGEFVQTYSPDDTWEDTSFEDYMLEFIKARAQA
jgi:hypothetical protein